MEPTDITIEVLKDIRKEIHTGLADVRAELKQGLAEVQRRQTETEVRLATELIGVASAVLQVRDLLRDDRAARTEVQDHERRIAALEKKVS